MIKLANNGNAHYTLEELRTRNAAFEKLWAPNRDQYLSKAGRGAKEPKERR